MTTLTVRERRELLADLTKAGVQFRACPTPEHLEVFADSPTEAGFQRWVEVPFTRAAIADAVAPLRIEKKLSTGEGWWLMPHRFGAQADREACLGQLRAANPNSQFRAA